MSSNLDKNKIKTDEHNIVSYLNTSLESDGISVSEDLIHRTLTAIKNQPVMDSSQQGEQIFPETQKKLPWLRHIRTAAIGAAACLILIVGIRGMNQQSKDGGRALRNESADGSNNYGLALKMDEEGAGDMADGSKELDAMSEPVEIAENSLTENGEKKSVGTLDADKALGWDNGVNAEVEETARETVTILDIASVAVEDISSIQITNSITNDFVLLSGEEQIQTVFEIFEVFGLEEVDKSSGDTRYVIHMTGKERESVLNIEEEFVVALSSVEKDTSKKAYRVSDARALLTGIETIYKKNK